MGTGDGNATRLRADARRNHSRLLDAARDVFVERGTGAPLDEVARRAGVGIATLYRRFPDRRTLLRAVVVQALETTCEAARTALAGDEEGLRRRPWTQVYTSRGVGTVHIPVRFLCRPEVALLTLTAAPRPPRAA